MSERRLIIMRHAEAEPDNAGGDAERALTSRGITQAENAGRSLARAGAVPERVICSTARRTRQTLAAVADRLERRPAVDYEPALYTADLDTAFELVARTDEAVGTLLVVGHNPTMGRLAATFPRVDGFAGEIMSFPPASVAMVDLEVTWLYAAPDTGTVRML